MFMLESKWAVRIRREMMRGLGARDEVWMGKRFSCSRFGCSC